MVKVQKPPQPKSLSKTQKIEGVSKEKLKAAKEKKTTAKVVAAADIVADIKKKSKEVKNVAEKSEKKASKDKTTEKPKASKKALVLAPPPSPAVATAPKAKGSKKVTAAPASPVAATPKPKLGKKPLVVAPTPSPVAVAPRKTKGGKKTLAVEEPVDVPTTPVEAAHKKKGGKKAAPVVEAEAAAKPKAIKKKLVEEAAPKEKKSAKKVADLAEDKTSQARGKKKDIAKPSPAVVEEKAAKKEKKQESTAATPKEAKSVKEIKPIKETKPAKKAEEVKGVKEVKPAKEVKPIKEAKTDKESSKQKELANGKAEKPVTKKLGKALKTKGAAAKENGVEKKPKREIELKYELKPFDEEQFFSIVSSANVQKVCDALKTQVAEEVKKQKSASIFKDYRYILQVCSYKIPSCPKRVVKLALKNSLVGSDDDVAIIVTDLQRGARFDYEPTVQHYEDLFREAGVEQKLTVVPFNQLRNDMGTFEAKRKFLNTYDYFLCDGRISGQAHAFLGQGTQKPRNVLHAVRLSKEDNLPKEITRSLCRTAYRQLHKGDLTAIPVGNHEFSGKQLAENVETVVNQLQQVYPGGLANIRSLYLKIDMVGTSALPLYISMCSPPADAPYVVGPREQRMLKLKKQANEVLSRFALTKDVNFVKLTDEQVKNKAEVRAKRLALQSADAKDENDEEDAVVPAKKARKEAAVEAVEAEEEDDDEDVGEDDDDVDEDEDEDDEDDDDDDDEDDDEDDEE
ncbi:ribosomal L1 domain-containing protein CG13096 [Drosophila sulfurigaster albostrigata]|uniref:ribosomal L1 domain-containing protein CG13096 n=1 Tax=Drosophila sulfurigaster albostrigata TaxID=89887 RepID=UPI002D21C84C|nr:ribosomal L1 domain-containing protein CG13096 [Drosophila sulfurigaster albostrigata]